MRVRIGVGGLVAVCAMLMWWTLVPAAPLVHDSKAGGAAEASVALTSTAPSAPRPRTD
jgi:hypothetical protein